MPIQSTHCVFSIQTNHILFLQYQQNQRLFFQYPSKSHTVCSISIEFIYCLFNIHQNHTLYQAGKLHENVKFGKHTVSCRTPIFSLVSSLKPLDLIDLYKILCLSCNIGLEKFGKAKFRKGTAHCKKSCA